jgi:hypothetical protein
MIQTEKWTDSGTILSTGAFKPNNECRAIGWDSEDSWLWFWRNVCGGSVGQLWGGGENLFNQRGRQSILLTLPSGLEAQP